MRYGYTSQYQVATRARKFLTFAALFAIVLSNPFAYAADAPQNSLNVNQVNSKDLMQGNDFYGIRTFQTTQKPDSVLGWFQQRTESGFCVV